MAPMNLGEGWKAVNVGPVTVGWVGPYIPVRSKSYIQAHITAFMGFKSFRLNIVELGLALFDIDGFWNNTDIVARMIYSSRRFAIRLPVGSLDLDDRGNIIYSKRSTETLHAALDRLFSAVICEVQAELHTCETPIEVVRKFAEFGAYGYPYEQCEDLRWRGLLLDNLLARTEMLVRVVEDVPVSVNRNTYRHAGLGKIRMLPRTSKFGSFVSWQTRSDYDHTRVTPEDVFLIRASSQEEYEQGQQLLQDEVLLWDFLIANGFWSAQDASFFLCPAGDPLEEWVDGTVLTVKDFSTTKRDGHS